MSLPALHRSAASRYRCASRLPTPPVIVTLVLSALAWSGCYDGPADLPDGSPWAGEDDSGSASGAEADGNADGPGATGNADGNNDGPGDTSDGNGSGDPTETGDSGGSTDDGGPPPADVPDIPYCDEVAGWETGWSQLEQDILTLVNEVRGQGANCGSQGNFGPA
nr:hypothetical protein [Deltaproteobacteria bacterium]